MTHPIAVTPLQAYGRVWETGRKRISFSLKSIRFPNKVTGTLCFTMFFFPELEHD